jgi:predicted  nucleic acid-binding Zn-ribbon protein
MTQQRRTALKELQKLDARIREARVRIQDFDPLFEQVEEPSLLLESELGTSRNRLKEMKLEERRLERATVEKRERISRLDERLGAVRNLREEAAVSAELEMVKRSLQSDEHEAYALIDQVRKGEERVEELEAAYTEASELVEPKKQELLGKRSAATKELEGLQKEREGFAAAMDPKELKVYDAIRDGGRRMAVAELTDDGACGHCFGIVPPQAQNEVRHGEALIRCEACGVILAAPEPGGVPDARSGEAARAADIDPSEDPSSTAEGPVEPAGSSDDASEAGPHHRPPKPAAASATLSGEGGGDDR